jgi:hypothetical protein
MLLFPSLALSLVASSLFCSPDCAAEYSIVVAMECTQRRPETSPQVACSLLAFDEEVKILTPREKKVSFLTFFSIRTFFFSLLLLQTSTKPEVMKSHRAAALALLALLVLSGSLGSANAKKAKAKRASKKTAKAADGADFVIAGESFLFFFRKHRAGAEIVEIPPPSSLSAMPCELLFPCSSRNRSRSIVLRVSPKMERDLRALNNPFRGSILLELSCSTRRSSLLL